MISKSAVSECFVYMTLPMETKAVLAGKFTISQAMRSSIVGRFVYGKTYLARQNAVEIDPVELKLTSSTYETARLHGVFGALRDAGPDYWGRTVIEKRSGSVLLGEMDYLLLSPEDNCRP